MPRAQKEGQADEVHGNHRHAARDSRGRERLRQQVGDGKGGKRRDERWNP